MTNGHTLFPLGILCAHCHRWHNLAGTIDHVEQWHPDCSTCRVEVDLARELLREANESLATVAELRADRAEAVAG